ncbi:MAG: enoyl-CoA hydratase/isomerase family protein [Phenylobacterium sp.]
MTSLAAEPLSHAGLAASDVAAWAKAEPTGVAAYANDGRRYSQFWTLTQELLARLPEKPARNGGEAAAAKALLDAGRAARERFLAAHAEAVYDALTADRSRFLRLAELTQAAAALVPGLVPDPEALARDAQARQADKDGLEVDQGIFLAHVLGRERSGLHLCHAMLLPRDAAAAGLADFARTGHLDLGPVRLERQGRAVHLTTRNPRVLNAEDDTTLEAMELAVDVAILDPASEVVVMRGGVIGEGKYAGRRVLGAGINLTRLYHGKIAYLWLLERDMGFVHKILRGVARPEVLPDDVAGTGIEKPWIAVLETFAVGGHCQLLLTVDYTIAARDGLITLPARKEGFIPGAANLLLARFTGDRIARQAIQYGREIPCDQPEALLLCDEIVEPEAMEAAIARVSGNLTSAGLISVIANRRCFRVAQEPLDLFRRYMATYAREQAYCHFSDALIANLERNWDARSRRL